MDIEGNVNVKTGMVEDSMPEEQESNDVQNSGTENEAVSYTHLTLPTILLV